MKESDTRRAAALLVARDDLEDWRASLEIAKTEHPDHAIVAFDDIAVRNKDGEGHGWEGGLRLPRDIAIRMLLREAAAIAEELTALGIEAEAPA
jgi:hypothetical protein